MINKKNFITSVVFGIGAVAVAANPSSAEAKKSDYEIGENGVAHIERHQPRNQISGRCDYHRLQQKMLMQMNGFFFQKVFAIESKVENWIPNNYQTVIKWRFFIN